MLIYLAMPPADRPKIIEVQNEVTRIHLADTDTSLSNLRAGDSGPLRIRLLLSYHYYQAVDLDAMFAKHFREPYPDVFADSGAFTAHTRGAEIDLDDYMAWLKRFGHLFSSYAGLDVIGDADATLANQKRMEDVGFTPIPTFHVQEPWSYLEDYIDDYNLVALGGMVPWLRLTKRIMPWLIRAFRMAEGKAVYHGFGATSWKIIAALPWYSVDSSSWGQGFRYGRVPVFDWKAGRFRALYLKDPKTIHRHGRLIRDLGFDPVDFSDPERYDRAKVCAIAALSYMLAEKWLRARHGDVMIPGTEGDPGPQVHMVAAASGATAKRGSNMSPQAIAAAAKLLDDGHGPRLHLGGLSPSSDWGAIASNDPNADA